MFKNGKIQLTTSLFFFYFLPITVEKKRVQILDTIECLLDFFSVARIDFQLHTFKCITHFYTRFLSIALGQMVTQIYLNLCLLRATQFFFLSLSLSCCHKTG